MKINSKLLGISVVAVILGSVLITIMLGIWTTTSTKIPVKYQSGEQEGAYNPLDIKGSYTFSEISNLFGVPAEDLAAAFSVDVNNVTTFKCKDLEGMYTADDGKEIGTDSVRVFVALYKGLPYTLADTTYLPAASEDILVNSGNMTEEQKLFLETHKK